MSFDSSASVSIRIEILEQKAVDLERTLRREMRIAEATWKKKGLRR